MLQIYDFSSFRPNKISKLNKLFVFLHSDSIAKLLIHANFTFCNGQESIRQMSVQAHLTLCQHWFTRKKTKTRLTTSAVQELCSKYNTLIVNHITIRRVQKMYYLELKSSLLPHNSLPPGAVNSAFHMPKDCLLVTRKPKNAKDNTKQGHIYATR